MYCISETINIFVTEGSKCPPLYTKWLKSSSRLFLTLDFSLSKTEE
jgi:hypothetical protein